MTPTKDLDDHSGSLQVPSVLCFSYLGDIGSEETEGCLTVSSLTWIDAPP